MKTKIGEVKSIRDLFEDKKEESRSPGQGGDYITSSMKCRLCDERVSGMDEIGACWAHNNGDNGHLLGGAMKKHIEVHLLIKELEI